MKKQMKFYFALPLLALPFITIAFACMGGGKSKAGVSQTAKGLNTRLPDAYVIKDSTKDKMAFYEQATADSVKRSEQLKNDPYTAKTEQTFTETDQAYAPIQEKVHAVRQRISAPEYQESAPVINGDRNDFAKGKNRSEEKATDPELEAINQTLDKLAALQHPVTATPSTVLKNENAIKVHASSGSDETFFGRRDSVVNRNPFFDTENASRTDASFAAIVPISQVLLAGSVVKLQLSEPFVLAEKTIPKGTLIFGIAAIENERLLIHIPSVKFENTIYPVALSVYDLDGLEGIYIPGSLSRDVIKSTADQSLQSVNVLSLDPSLKTQAAIAGIGAAKSLLTRKVRQVKVRVESGYKILLKDKKQQ